MSVEQHRDFYAALVTAKGGTHDEAIRSCFASTDRARFAGPGPWKVFTPLGYIETPSNDPVFLYQDVVVAVAPDRRINNGEPSLHARCLAAAAPKVGESVLHVGAGAGYYTAILAGLVGREGQVVGYEIETDLAERARENLADLPQVSIRTRSAIEPDLPQSDVIYVNAGATHPPAEWLAALKLKGRLLFPLSGTQGAGVMVLITRDADESYSAQIIMGAAFIPCIGATDDAEAMAVTKALMKGGAGAVRSLIRNDEPDASAWIAGRGWWFSASPNRSP